MFKVGDIITGLPSSNREYGLTNSGCTMKVHKIDGDMIVVTILDLDTYVGYNFTVDPTFFRLVDSPIPVEKTAVERKIAFMYRRFEER